MRITRSREPDRLIMRALRERWPLSQAMKKECLDRLGQIIADPETKPRLLMSAIRSLMTCTQSNLEAIKTEIAAEEQATITEDLVHLGDYNA